MHVVKNHLNYTLQKDSVLTDQQAVTFFSHALDMLCTLKRFSKTTIIKLFADQSEVYALTAVCINIDRISSVQALHVWNLLKHL